MFSNVRIRLVARLAALFLLINTVVRGGLMAAAGREAFDGWSSLPLMLFGGMVNDIPAFVLMASPFVLLLFLPRTGILGSRWRAVYRTLFLLYLAIFLFTAVAEALFWDEFSSRFNFIAVDYLIYPTRRKTSPFRGRI